MNRSEIRFEDLIGRVVQNEHGRPIGRIEDLRVEPDGEDYLVTDFLLGPLEWFARLLAFAGQVPTLRVLGIGRERRIRAIPWHWMDLSDPERPVLTAEGAEKAEGAEEREKAEQAEKRKRKRRTT
jgi:sporulation protein YlmC with PRC-barrel domain